MIFCFFGKNLIVASVECLDSTSRVFQTFKARWVFQECFKRLKIVSTVFQRLFQEFMSIFSKVYKVYFKGLSWLVHVLFKSCSRVVHSCSKLFKSVQTVFKPNAMLTLVPIQLFLVKTSPPYYDKQTT